MRRGEAVAPSSDAPAPARSPAGRRVALLDGGARPRRSALDASWTQAPSALAAREVLAHDAQLRQVVHVVIEQRHLGDRDAGRARAEPPELAPLRRRAAPRTRARPAASRAAASSSVAAGSAADAGVARAAPPRSRPPRRGPAPACTRLATKPAERDARRAQPLVEVQRLVDRRHLRHQHQQEARRPARAAACRPTAARARKPLSTSWKSTRNAPDVVEEPAADQLRQPAHQQRAARTQPLQREAAWPPRAGARTRSAPGWRPRPRCARARPGSRARSPSAACRARRDRTARSSTKSCSASVAAYSCDPVSVVVICR